MSAQAPCGRELYVYWKTGEPEIARAVVRQAQAALCASEPALQARLLEREGDAESTLMEIYTHPHGIGLDLQGRIERTMSAATGRLRQGRRTVEIFVPAPDRA